MTEHMEQQLRNLEWCLNAGELPRPMRAVALSILPEYRLLRALADAMEALDAACTGEASAAVAGAMLAWQRWKGGTPPP